jgi:hypothetical protein
MSKARESANAWRQARKKDLLVPLPHFGDHLTLAVLLSTNTGPRRGELLKFRAQRRGNSDLKSFFWRNECLNLFDGKVDLHFKGFFANRSTGTPSIANNTVLRRVRSWMRFIIRADRNTYRRREQ